MTRIVPIFAILLMGTQVLAASGNRRAPRRVSRSRLAENYRQLHEAINRTPIRTRFVDTNPLARRINASLHGLDKAKTRKDIAKLITAQEKVWGKKVTVPNSVAIRDKQLFKAEKTASMVRMGVKPSEVTEGWIEVGKSVVDGVTIPARRVFYRRYKARGKASGRVVVCSPGYDETGRNFDTQVPLLMQQGDEVITIDHQWGGYTSKPGGVGPASPGGFDGAFGVARDAAAGLVLGELLAKKLHGKRGQVVPLGVSMGYGPGVLGAAALASAGKMQLTLSGKAEGVNLLGRQLTLSNMKHLVGEGGFVGITPGKINNTLVFLGKRLPRFMAEAPLAPIGLPLISTSGVANARFAGHVVREGTPNRAVSMVKADKQLKVIIGLVEQGYPKNVELHSVHAAKDSLAFTEKIEHTVASHKAAGSPNDTLKILANTDHHTLALDPKYLTEGPALIAKYATPISIKPASIK